MVGNIIRSKTKLSMATFSLVIVPAKELSDGIVQRPGKDLLNIKLQEWYNTYFKRYIELEHAESSTCAQLVKMITNPITGEHNRKFEDIINEFLSQIDESDREKTHLRKSKLSPTSIKIYITLLKVIMNYAIKMRYIKYKVDPFVTASIPSTKKRDI